MQGHSHLSPEQSLPLFDQAAAEVLQMDATLQQRVEALTDRLPKDERAEFGRLMGIIPEAEERFGVETIRVASMGLPRGSAENPNIFARLDLTRKLIETNSLQKLRAMDASSAITVRLVTKYSRDAPGHEASEDSSDLLFTQLFKENKLQRAARIRNRVNQYGLIPKLSQKAQEIDRQVETDVRVQTGPARMLDETGELPHDVRRAVAERAKQHFDQKLDQKLADVEEASNKSVRGIVGKIGLRAAGMEQAGQYRTKEQRQRAISHSIYELRSFLTSRQNVSLELQEEAVQLLAENGFYTKSGMDGERILTSITTQANQQFDSFAGQVEGDLDRQLATEFGGQRQEQTGRKRPMPQEREVNPVAVAIDEEVAVLRREGLPEKTIYRKLVKKYHSDGSQGKSNEEKIRYITTNLKPQVKRH